jgi:hypothetical protein
MAQGEIGLELTPADLVTLSGTFSELRFREPEQEPVFIMAYADSKPALACKKCGFFMIISDPDYSDTNCIVCHTSMPAGVTSCPKCGWSYEQSS